jgi:predicted ArsR family transcriptional regulator
MGGALSDQPLPSWTFLTNHAHVMVAIWRNPQITAREIADQVGITLRGAQRIIHELERDGYLTHERVGRNNRYQIREEQPLRHPMDGRVAIGALLTLVGGLGTLL